MIKTAAAVAIATTWALVAGVAGASATQNPTTHMGRVVAVKHVDATITVTRQVTSPSMRTDQRPPIGRSLASAKRNAGNVTWWGYRSNSWQTWAFATEHPGTPNWTKYISWMYLPGALVKAVNVMGWDWHYAAMNARSFGECLGITWAGTGIWVGCSSS